MIVLVVLEAVGLMLLGLLVVGLLRSHADILRRLHELGVGLEPSPSGASRSSVSALGIASERADVAAHDIAGVTPRGEAVAIGLIGAPGRAVVAFLSSGCLTCETFWRAFARPDRLRLAHDTRVVVVTKGPDAESVSAVAALAPQDLAVVMSTQVWESYDVPGSPYFVLVDGPSGRVVGEGTSTTWEQVRNLMGQADDDASAAASRRRRSRENDRDRREVVDAELLAAGIGPGHPSLFAFPDREPEGTAQPEP